MSPKKCILESTHTQQQIQGLKLPVVAETAHHVCLSINMNSLTCQLFQLPPPVRFVQSLL
ncbi:hypothetical protein BaRGS_00016435, partial [Batillaria attramentaria]